MTRAKTKSKTKSLADIFLVFVRDNPKAAADLAFQLGMWAGYSTVSLAKFKKGYKIPPMLLHAIPQGVTNSALKLLPHASPILQPGLATKRRRSWNGRRKLR